MEDFEIIRKQEADPYYFHPCLKFEEHIVDGFLSICKAPPPFSFVASQACNKRSVGAVATESFPPLTNERFFENKKTKKTGCFDCRASSSTDSQELPFTFERDTSKARHKRTRKLLLKDKRARY
ncbi:Schizosaccharomyces specific protein Mug103 [Schizosaccharomyces osmophilus]|uniref:Schizosaccharomyces specific protein Mug103 n=1 Tax=Schizosaccharomyces osmophilus TaxID=2545709 RepID=A0AAF0ATY0_9SCHI|nr:Schizosaccharomyces specific protein Mug103 [Schizosaccharomyces osmophilus]WBW71941.1 Schizosaccharomyces specific protein Mug103 [Schizosaccharomyces osmophilus]